MPFRDDDRQGLDPREFPEPDETSEDCTPCPHCSAMVYDDSERCPNCGYYLSAEEGGQDKPLWLIAGILLCLAIALFWVFSAG